jgi:hypothetical protein
MQLPRVKAGGLRLEIIANLLGKGEVEASLFICLRSDSV